MSIAPVIPLRPLPDPKPYPVEFWKELDCCLDPDVKNWRWKVWHVASARHAEMHGRKYLYQFLTMLHRHPELVGYNVLHDMVRSSVRYQSGDRGYRDVYAKSFFEELERLLLLKVECFNPWENDPE